MDKCTAEQFWAVASLTAADAFIVSHKDILTKANPLLVLAIITVATVYGIWFVIQRHLGYYRNRDDMAVLLARELGCPRGS